MSFYARQAFGLAGRPPTEASNGGHRQASSSSAQQQQQSHHQQQNHQRLTFQEDHATFEEVPIGIDGSIHAGQYDEHEFSQVTLSQAFSHGSNHSASTSAADKLARRWQQHRAESARGKAAAEHRPRRRQDDARDDRDGGARRPGAPPRHHQRRAQPPSRTGDGGGGRDRRASSRRRQERHAARDGDEDAATARSSQPLLSTQDIQQISGGQGRQQPQPPPQRDHASAGRRPRHQQRPPSGGRTGGGASVRFERHGGGDDGATVQSRASRSLLSAIPPLRGRRRSAGGDGPASLSQQGGQPPAGRRAADREPYRTPLRSRSPPPPAASHRREPSLAAREASLPPGRDGGNGRREPLPESNHHRHQQRGPSASALSRPTSYLTIPTPAKVVRSAIKLAGSLTPFATGRPPALAAQRTLLSQPPAGPPSRVLRGALLSMRTLGLSQRPAPPGREITPPQRGPPQGAATAGAAARTPPPPGREGPSGPSAAAGPGGILTGGHGGGGDSGTRDSDASDSYGTAMDVEQSDVVAAKETRSLVKSAGDGSDEEQPTAQPVVKTSNSSARQNHDPEESENSALSDSNDKEAPESSEIKSSAANDESHKKAAQVQQQLEDTLSKIKASLQEVKQEREQLDKSKRELADLRAEIEEDRAKFESLKDSLDKRYGGLQKSIESFSTKMSSTSHETESKLRLLIEESRSNLKHESARAVKSMSSTKDELRANLVAEIATIRDAASESIVRSVDGIVAKARVDLQRLMDETGDAHRPTGVDVGNLNAGHHEETRNEKEQSHLHEPQATAKLPKARHDNQAMATRDEYGDNESTIDASLPMDTKENNVRLSHPAELPARNATPLRDSNLSPPPKAASGAKKNIKITAKRLSAAPPGSAMTASATFSTKTTPQQGNHGKKGHPKKSSFEAELRNEFSVIQSPHSSRCNSARQMQNESTNFKANEGSKQLPPAPEYDARADDQPKVNPTKESSTNPARSLPSKKHREARKSEGAIKSATRRSASSNPRQPARATSKSTKKRAHSATNPLRSPRRSKRLKETARAEQAPKALTAMERSDAKTQSTKGKPAHSSREEDAKPSQPTLEGKPRAPSEAFDLDSNNETFDPLLGTQVTFADAEDMAGVVPGLDESEAYEEAPKAKQHLSIFGGRLGGWASGKSRARKKKRMMTKKKKRSSAIELDFD